MSQPHHDLDLEVINLHLAMQEGLGFFNMPHVFQALLSQGLVKTVQHFPSACKGEANTDLSES